MPTYAKPTWLSLEGFPLTSSLSYSTSRSISLGVSQKKTPTGDDVLNF